MAQESVSSRAARIIGGRVYGPFNAEGLPGEWQTWRLNTAAHNYLWNRRVRKMGAREALRAALPVALRPHTVRVPQWYGPQWYGPRGGAGAPFKSGNDSLRWIESTEAAGLRFVGWADDMAPQSVRHFGWYCEADSYGDTLRGGVWQLPGSNGNARLVYGYAEFESRNREMNPGSAAICVSDIVCQPMRGEFGNIDETDGARDAARWADGLAESQAEREREYDSAYQAGRAAAEMDSEAVAARRELLPLLAELRGERKAGGANRPAICAALRATVDSLLGTIADKRAERDSAWGECPSWHESAWAAGFMDESDGGFVRAVRLGFAKASDWQGAPADNPCGPMAAA